MASEAQRLNRYTCQVCRGTITTMDVDDGTTPFMLDCHATEGCHGTMTSSMYRVPIDAVPTFVWRKATAEEYKAASPAMRHHFDLGGLDIFPIQ